MNIVNILLQNIRYFMKNVRLRTFFPDFALLVEEAEKNNFQAFKFEHFQRTSVFNFKPRCLKDAATVRGKKLI